MNPEIKKHLEGIIKEYVTKKGNIRFTHEAFADYISERAKANNGKHTLTAGQERTKAVAEYMKRSPAQFKKDTLLEFNKRIIKILQGIDNAAADADNISWAINQIAIAEYMFDSNDKLSIRIRTNLSAEYIDIKTDNLSAKDNIGTIPPKPKQANTPIGHVINTVRNIDRKITKHQINKQNNRIEMLKDDLGHTPDKNNQWQQVEKGGELFRRMLYSLRYSYGLKDKVSVAENRGIDIIKY